MPSAHAYAFSPVDSQRRPATDTYRTPIVDVCVPSIFRLRVNACVFNYLWILNCILARSIIAWKSCSSTLPILTTVGFHAVPLKPALSLLLHCIWLMAYTVYQSFVVAHIQSCFFSRLDDNRLERIQIELINKRITLHAIAIRINLDF